MVSVVPVPIVAVPLDPTVPPVATKGNTVFTQTDAGSGEIDISEGRGLTVTVYVAVLAHNVPLD